MFRAQTATNFPIEVIESAARNYCLYKTESKLLCSTADQTPARHQLSLLAVVSIVASRVATWGVSVTSQSSELRHDERKENQTRSLCVCVEISLMYEKSIFASLSDVHVRRSVTTGNDYFTLEWRWTKNNKSLKRSANSSNSPAINKSTESAMFSTVCRWTCTVILLLCFRYFQQKLSVYTGKQQKDFCAK